MNGKQLTGAALALAAAGLFGSLPAVAAETAQASGVHCYGVNACKGQGSCKGQGWVTKSSAEECTAAGGTVK